MHHDEGEIRGLMPFVESCKNVPATPSARKAFSDERGWIENRIVFVIADSLADDSGGYEHCVYLAAWLYHYTVSRPLCIWSGVHAIIAEKLKSTLLKTKLSTFWQPYQELLLWILMTAAPACVEGPKKV